MKQFKTYAVIILLAVLIVPSVAFASWWNPFSWHWFNIFNMFFKPQTTIVQPNQNANQATGWQTYTDPQQRFNIKYPSNWHNIQDFKNDDVIFCSANDKDCSINAIYVYVYTKGGAKDILNNWRQQGSAYKETNIVVDGNNATERQESLCNGTPLLTNGIFIEGTNYDFQVQGPISECGSTKDKIQADYDKSLQKYLTLYFKQRSLWVRDIDMAQSRAEPNN